MYGSSCEMTGMPPGSANPFNEYADIREAGISDRRSSTPLDQASMRHQPASPCTFHAAPRFSPDPALNEVGRSCAHTLVKNVRASFDEHN